LVRSLILTGVIVAGVSVLAFGRQTSTSTGLDLPQLSYVTTAHQLGVVGYRDPVGAISPDGKHFAYSEGRFIRVVPIGGGAPVTLAPPAEGQIRHLIWTTNSHVAIEDATPSGRWWLYDLAKDGRARLGTLDRNNELRQLTCRGTGEGCSGLRFTSGGAELASLASDVEVRGIQGRIEGRASWPAFRMNGDIGCVVNVRLTLPCGGVALKFDPDRDVFGPIAFSPEGNTVYFSSPNDRGMVELWSADLATRRARQLSNFSRDAYAPSVSSDGTVVFKVQSYRTHLADVAFEGGPTRQLTTFQSETPSYHPTRPLIAFTYGTWRRIIDDAKYPDIAQDIGVIDIAPAFRRGISSPATKPSEVLEDSDSEDQAMTWSPNGKWIAFHTHKEMSDDIWLRPADGSQPDKRITFLGRGAEVGWPRWSPDGKTVLLNGARKSDGASVLYTIGVNQDTGALTSDLREVKVEGITGEMGHAEWLPGSTTVVATVKEGPGRHAIFSAPVGGGRVTVIHRFDTEHDFSGLGVSTNGRFVAFAAPAPDGFYQIFVKTIGGATPAVQLTTDRSHKTQPTFSPDGARVAFTVWSYEAAFWSFKSR
jgi:WD40 repeat protein